jgi:hypothetical protein
VDREQKEGSCNEIGSALLRVGICGLKTAVGAACARTTTAREGSPSMIASSTPMRMYLPGTMDDRSCVRREADVNLTAGRPCRELPSPTEGPAWPSTGFQPVKGNEFAKAFVKDGR